MNFRRQSTAAFELGGQKIGADEKVVFFHVSANRDETVFENPHAFDITRDPNPHIAFGGGGPHFCLGANLARMEIRVMFEHLLDRMPDIRLDGEVQRLQSQFISGIKHIPVAFPPSLPRVGVSGHEQILGQPQRGHSGLPPGSGHRRGPASVRRAGHHRRLDGRDRRRSRRGPFDRLRLLCQPGRAPRGLSQADAATNSWRASPRTGTGTPSRGPGCASSSRGCSNDSTTTLPSSAWP